MALLQVDRLPSGATPKPVWLWYSGVHATDTTSPAEADRLWQAFLRRFDIEHTFRMLKQALGWTCPKTRTPAAADRWTWLVLAAYTQLRLCPTSGRGPAPPVGKTSCTQPAHPSPCPQGLSTPARENRLPCSSTETHPTRPRTPIRTTQPTTHHTPRRSHRHGHSQHEDIEEESNNSPAPTPTTRLKIKLAERTRGVSPHAPGSRSAPGDVYHRGDDEAVASIEMPVPGRTGFQIPDASLAVDDSQTR